MRLLIALQVSSVVSHILLGLPETGQQLLRISQLLLLLRQAGSRPTEVTSCSLSKVPAAIAKAPFFSSDELRIRGEIFWVLHITDSHFSFNLAARLWDQFRLMFCDSTIAQH